MEKQKIDTYNAGYQAPVPVELGRWYEKVSQKDIDDFNGREEERRRNWAENKQRENKGKRKQMKIQKMIFMEI